MKRGTELAGLVALALLSGCATRLGTRAPLAAARPLIAATSSGAAPSGTVVRTTALTTGARVVPLPDLSAVTAATLVAFRRSCPALAARDDLSGLTHLEDWAAVCAAARRATDAAGFFAANFAAVQVGDGRGLDTGYFEPELPASRRAAPGYSVPLYRRPPDLIEVDLRRFDPALAGKRVWGRVAGTTLVPYPDRAVIDAGALAGHGLELAYAADPYAAFFLEIQGSGRLLLTDGSVMRVGYDGQNGQPYVGIGKLLRERGALAQGQATMAGIIGWLRAHPDEAPALLRANGSKIFFRELTGLAATDGPPGALGVPLTAGVSVAADPRFVPLGAPLWLDTSVAGIGPVAQLMVAQDSGGAILGANRLDLFWGSGDAAGAIAGGITAIGTVKLLLPKTAAARLSEKPASKTPALSPAPDAPPRR